MTRQGKTIFLILLIPVISRCGYPSLAPGFFEPAEIFLYCFFVFAGDFIITYGRGCAVSGGLDDFRKISLRFAFDLRFLKIPTGYDRSLGLLVFQTGSLRGCIIRCGSAGAIARTRTSGTGP